MGFEAASRFEGAVETAIEVRRLKWANWWCGRSVPLTNEVSDSAEGSLGEHEFVINDTRGKKAQLLATPGHEVEERCEQLPVSRDCLLEREEVVL
jgi:hypothetical protein